MMRARICLAREVGFARVQARAASDQKRSPVAIMVPDKAALTL
jgi:hypothetical protein